MPLALGVLDRRRSRRNVVVLSVGGVLIVLNRVMFRFFCPLRAWETTKLVVTNGT